MTVFGRVAYATLHRRAGRGCYFDEHRIWNARTETGLDFPNWEWAEVDGGRLLWAEAGKIFTGRLDAKGSGGWGSVEQLLDANALRRKARCSLLNQPLSCFVERWQA